MARCNTVSKKRSKTMPGYKCNPLENHCLKYSTIPKCMKSINPAEENAGIRCTGSLDSCKSGCANLHARMRGVSGPVVSNKEVMQRHQAKQARKRALAQIGRQQSAMLQMRQRQLGQRQATVAARPRPVAHTPATPQPVQPVSYVVRREGGYVLGGSGGGGSRLLSGGIPGAPSVWYKDNSRTCQAVLSGGKRHKELAKNRYKIYSTKALCNSRR